ncbi:T9SS type A sorting domain-containing protein, partial [Aequorivita viscosa]
NQQFEAINNTNINTLNAGEAYLLFVRGDRSIDLTNNLASNNTVIRATGSLTAGNYVQNFNTGAQGAFAMFGNPYQSTININSVFANSTNIDVSKYYVYDPSLGDFGAYVTVSLPAGTNTSNSAANQYLQPGQGGQFATLNSGASSIIFNEADKTPGFHTTTNIDDNRLTTHNMLTVQLYTSENLNNGGPVHDSFGIIFDAEFSNHITADDAVKPWNFKENLGIDNNSTFLSIEKRAMPLAAEVYNLFSNGYTHNNYSLKFKIDGLEDVSFYLDDNYTGSSTLVENSEFTYSFSVNTDELSTATNRFSIRVASRLGLEDNDDFTGIHLFPNPTKGNIFYIHSPQLNGKQVEISIADLTGREIYNKNLDCTDNMITISGNNSWSPGVYLVTLKHEGEKKTYKLVMESL